MKNLKIAECFLKNGNLMWHLKKGKISLREDNVGKKCLQNKISHTQKNNGPSLKPVFKMVCLFYLCMVLVYQTF